MARANVVVTCTHRKSMPVPAELQMRSIGESATLERFRAWTRRLSATSARRLPASDIYQGDHWSIARSIVTSDVSVWIASAGYGLISPETRIVPYGATFTQPHPDSACLGPTADWWDLLNSWSTSSLPGIRSLQQLAASSPDTPLLVAASPPYLEAMRNDLAWARGSLTNPDLLTIISTGTPRLEGLQGHLLPCDGRVQTVVGGSLISLNVRLLRHALQDCPTLTRTALTTWALSLCSGLKRPDRPKRLPATDDDVEGFVETLLDRDPSASHTRALRHLRASGYACEQSRFKTIFIEVVGRRHAS